MSDPIFPGENESTNELWTEKYRPQTLDDVIGQEEVIKILKAYESKPIPEIPMFLFYGTYGVGKTATAIAFLRDRIPLFHENSAKDRGTDFAKYINTIVKRPVSMFQFIHPPFNKPTDGKWDGIKIIIDEAEQITPMAQIMMRDSMERGGYAAKVIMITNDVRKVDQGLRKRFVELQFTPLKEQSMRKLAERIIQAEQLKIPDDDLAYIIKASVGIPRDFIKHLNLYAKAGVLPQQQDTLNEY